MKAISINNRNRVSLHGGNSAGTLQRGSQNEETYEQNRPAKATAPSGSERLNSKDEISFTGGSAKDIQKIAAEVLKGGQENIPKWAEKMGGANWFKGLLHSVDKNEAFYEAFVALGVAGVLKPICVLSMPGAEKEDKQMAATKNAVSAGMGFILSNLILGPFSSAVNKITKSFNSANPTKYIKDSKYVESLKNLNLESGAKSTLGDAYKSAFKKFPDLGVAPLKAGVTIALTPIVLKKVFGMTKKDKKSKNPMLQMPIMNAIKMDSMQNDKNKTNAPQNTSFKGSLKNQPSFRGDKVSQTIELAEETVKKNKHLIGRAKDAYTDALGKPLAKVIGRVSTTKPAQWVVKQTSRFEKPSPRWSDLASVAITLFYMKNTWESKKIDEERKLPLMINNGMVTVASSIAAFLIDKYTDKPMDNLLKGYLQKHEVNLHEKSNAHIKTVLKNIKDMAKPTDVETNNVKQLLESGKDILKGGIDVGTGHLKEAIEALNNDSIIQDAIKKGLIKSEEVAEMAVSGFSQQASKIYKNISKTKSLTIFTITVRFLVTVLMTPVIGKVVAIVNKKRGKVPNDKNNQQKQNPNDIGMKDYLNSLKK